MLIIVRGLPGSGKSYCGRWLANALGCGFVEPDMFCVKGCRYGYTPMGYIDAKASAVVVTNVYGEKEADLVYADVLPSIGEIKYVAHQYGQKPRMILTLNISRDQSIDRNIHRVSIADIDCMINNWQNPSADEAKDLSEWDPSSGVPIEVTLQDVFYSLRGV